MRARLVELCQQDREEGSSRRGSGSAAWKLMAALALFLSFLHFAAAGADPTDRCVPLESPGIPFACSPAFAGPWSRLDPFFGEICGLDTIERPSAVGVQLELFKKALQCQSVHVRNCIYIIVPPVWDSSATACLASNGFVC